MYVLFFELAQMYVVFPFYFSAAPCNKTKGPQKNTPKNKEQKTKGANAC
jgi:hypothetical protein